MSQQGKVIIVSFAAVIFILIVFILRPEKSTAPIVSIPADISENLGNSAASLPQPTGKVDDTAEAVLEELEQESDLLKEEEMRAVDFVDVEEEADDFGAIYDENEF